MPVIRPFCLILLLLVSPFAFSTSDPLPKVLIGSTMDLSEQASGVARELLVGLRAAFAEARRANQFDIEHRVRDDRYNPALTPDLTQALIDEGVIAMVGNTGSVNSKVSLPLLAEGKVPAIGFFTGSDLLRPGVGAVINYRASYADEVAQLVDYFVAQGYGPQEICAYAQADPFGLAGVRGLYRHLQTRYGDQPALRPALEGLAYLTSFSDEAQLERNYLAPVGFYNRNTLKMFPGYHSLATWHEYAGFPCRAVIVIGTQEPALQFLNYVRYKGIDWDFGLVSVMSQDYLEQQLARIDNVGRVIFTQMVPPLEAPLRLIQEAKAAIDPEQLNPTSFEGYIVGRLVVHGLASLKAQGRPLTGENLASALLGQRFTLSDLPLDFSDDNQGVQAIWLLRYEPAQGRFIEIDSPRASRYPEGLTSPRQRLAGAL